MNKWSLICSTFLGTINFLHFTSLFVFITSRYHIIFSFLPSHFSSMEQMLMLISVIFSVIFAHLSGFKGLFHLLFFHDTKSFTQGIYRLELSRICFLNVSHISSTELIAESRILLQSMLHDFLRWSYLTFEKFSLCLTPGTFILKLHTISRTTWSLLPSGAR